MSNTSKTVISVVVTILVIIAAWWYVSKEKAVAPSQSLEANSSVTSTSDASIKEDTTQIDAQLNGLNSDSASIDQGLNDTPIPQDQ